MPTRSPQWAPSPGGLSSTVQALPPFARGHGRLFPKGGPPQPRNPWGTLETGSAGMAAPLRGRLGVLGLQLLDVLANGEGVEVDNSFLSLHVLFGPVGPCRCQGVRRETLSGCIPLRPNAAAPSLVHEMAVRVAGALPVAGR